jgi:hypothetical protein
MMSQCGHHPRFTFSFTRADQAGLAGLVVMGQDNLF